MQRALGRDVTVLNLFEAVGAHAAWAQETVTKLDRGDDTMLTTGTTPLIRAAKAADVAAVRAKCHLPVYLGSGVTAANLRQFRNADGFIIGSHFKQDGHWSGAVDARRVEKFMAAHGKLA